MEFEQKNNVDNDTTSINVDQIVNNYCKENNIKTSMLNDDNIIFKELIETKKLDVANDLNKNLDLLNDLDSINKKLNSLDSRLSNHNNKNNDLYNQKINKAIDNINLSPKNQNLVNNFVKVEPDDESKDNITKQNIIEDQILFNTKPMNNQESKNKKKSFFNFRKQKSVSLNDYNPVEVVNKINEQEILNESLNNENKEANNISAKENKINKKELKAKIPKFYKFEIGVTIFWLSVTTLFFALSLATLGLSLNSILNDNYSYWLLLPQVIFNFVSLIFLILNINSLRSAYKELKINNYQLNRELPSAFIKKKYKSIITFNILYNWYSFAVYLIWSFAILLTLIITYFINLINYDINQFGYLYTGNDNTPLIMVIVFGILIGITFILQMVSFIFNKKRQSEIDVYYQKEILSDDVVLKYKKSANKKGMIIFFTITFIMTFVVLLTWLILRRKAKKIVKNN